jgi:DNA-directed RNA polymerase specialized sigma24 family protein
VRGRAASDLSPDDEALIRDLYPSLRRFAAVIRPAEVEADDLLQEAMYQVLRRGRLSDIPYPAAYLRRTMTNLASNHRRSLGRRRRALNRLGGNESEKPDYPSDVADLMMLPPRSRAVLYMRAVERRPVPEIAEELGCTEAAARGIELRARRSLRLALSEESRDATA